MIFAPNQKRNVFFDKKTHARYEDLRNNSEENLSKPFRFQSDFASGKRKWILF